MLFAEILEPREASPATHLLTVRVRRSLKAASPRLRIADWAAGDGPDGEQFSCLVDLIRDRLAGDALLASRCASAIRADDCAERSLRMLAARLEGAGHGGAARGCRRAVHDLAPAPARMSLITVMQQPRPA
jgi:hypothetical protein